jgi:hypothetical protein
MAERIAHAQNSGKKGGGRSNGAVMGYSVNLRFCITL